MGQVPSGGLNRPRDRQPEAVAPLPTVTPSTICKLRLLKMERIKDYLLMEEEFVANQERLEKAEEERSTTVHENHVDKDQLEHGCSILMHNKVRKEKPGDRIAVLHQLVSPFGKTDTTSVLSEAIGYIRFLQSQIEALSHPYFGTNASGNMMNQHLQGDRSCLFPEDPGQRRGASSLSTENQNANEEPKKDLRSRGLCLIPISCCPAYSKATEPMNLCHVECQP